MALADALDLRELLASAAEPDVHVGILDADLLREIGDFHAGIACGFEGGEDLLLDLATGSALGGGTGLGCLCSLCGATGLLRFGGAATALSGGAGRLAGDQGSELGLDLLDLVKKAFLALSELDKVLQCCAANVCDVHNKVSYFISLTG